MNWRAVRRQGEASFAAKQDRVAAYGKAGRVLSDRHAAKQGVNPVAECLSQCPLRHPAGAGSCSHRCCSGFQRHSANKRFRSGNERSPLMKNPRRSQSASPGHLPVHGWRRGSFGSKPMQPSACPPQCGQRSTSQPSLCFSPTGTPQSGQFFIVLAPVTCRPVLGSGTEPKIEPPKRRA